MDDEPTILNHYNLTTLYPESWPAEKDESDASDEDAVATRQISVARRSSKSRYSALVRAGSGRRSLVPGSVKIGNGVETLVQKDETDPLSGADSVVRILREKGLPVEDDIRLRRVVGCDRSIPYADRGQAIAFYSPLLPSHRNYISLKFIPTLPPSRC